MSTYNNGSSPVLQAKNLTAQPYASKAHVERTGRFFDCIRARWDASELSDLQTARIAKVWTDNRIDPDTKLAETVFTFLLGPDLSEQVSIDHYTENWQQIADEFNLFMFTLTRIEGHA